MTMPNEDETIARLKGLLEKALANDPDYMIATGDDLDWLSAQLACFPTRVAERKTTNLNFLMLSAAATLATMAEQARGAREAAIEECARLADQLGAVRPRAPMRDPRDREGRTDQVIRAQHVRAATIAAAIRALKSTPPVKEG